MAQKNMATSTPLGADQETSGQSSEAQDVLPRPATYTKPTITFSNIHVSFEPYTLRIGDKKLSYRLFVATFLDDMVPVKIKVYPLCPTTKQRLLEIRKHDLDPQNKDSKTKHIVYKEEGKLFVGCIPVTLDLDSSLFNDSQHFHKCGYCERCSPSSCGKLEALPYYKLLKQQYPVEEAIIESSKIEDFPFIRRGFQVIQPAPTFYVAVCKNYSESLNPKLHPSEIPELPDYASRLVGQVEEMTACAFEGRRVSQKMHSEYYV